MRISGGWTAETGTPGLTNAAGPALLAACVAALYYIPFVLHPQFSRTASYLGGSRLGGGFLNDNTALLLLSGWSTIPPITWSSRSLPCGA